MNDPENSTVLNAAVAKRRVGEQTIPRSSPKKSKQSLGGAEGAHKWVESQFRTLSFAVKARSSNVEISLVYVIIAWIVRYLGWLYNRFQLRKNGKTVHEGLFGKPYNGTILELGGCA